MFIKSIEIENIGPIDQLKIDFPIEDGKPKPVVIVGENGTGKTILLSHLVNSLSLARQEIYDDSEVEKGRVYKYRSPLYIRSGADYSYSCVLFENGIRVEECQLRSSKKEFEEKLGYGPARKIWNDIPTNDSSALRTNINRENARELIEEQCCLYFPVNRFEEPGWLNVENLTSKATYSELKRLTGQSNRNLIAMSPLRANRNWLLDVIFDRNVYELKSAPMKLPQGQSVQLHVGFDGPSSSIFEAAIKVLRVVLQAEKVRFGAGPRHNRQIAVMKDEKEWIPNVFQLSTGEALLLNLFLTIIRDYDLSQGPLEKYTDVKGIVVIDEVDTHLHTIHQKEVLPELIASFPNVQFVITTHSPLFLLGLEQKLGSDSFVILNMPKGERVAGADFSEFNAAYQAFSETTRHREEIRAELEKTAIPIVFVEGDYDVRYLHAAATRLGREATLARVTLKNGGGYGNLDKIWSRYDNAISEVLPSKILLLYDCDVSRASGRRGLAYRKSIPSVPANPIRVGIENLFSDATISKVATHDAKFIDFREALTKRERGTTKVIPAEKSVNKDEKGNMCDWLCTYGTVEDFADFAAVFDLIDDVLSDEPLTSVT